MSANGHQSGQMPFYWCVARRGTMTGQRRALALETDMENE